MRTSKDLGWLMKLTIGASLVLIVAFVGCSQKSQLSGGGSPSLADAITVTASPSSISTSATTIIEATVWADGLAIPNEIVTFTVSPLGIGTLTPAVDTSDAQGIVATVFTPVGLGQATITASTADGSISATTIISVEDDEASTGNALVWVSATPATLRTGQVETISLRIEVRDSLQLAPPESTMVIVVIGENFIDNNGDGYYTLGEDQLTDFNGNGWWDSFGTYDSIAYTDAVGIATVILTGQSDVTRTILVRATIRDDVLTGFDKEFVYFEPIDNSANGDLGMTTDATQLVADGSSTATISLEVRDADGNPAPAGVEVLLVVGEKFQDNNGDGSFTAGVDQLLIDANGNGLWDAMGTITSPVTTDAQGIATATFTAGTEPYDVYIQAVVNDAALTGSREMMLFMSPLVVLNTIFLYSDSMHLSVISTGGIQTAMLHAIGFDVDGNPVPSGYLITFTIVNSPGGGEHLYDNANTADPYTVVTDETGTASVSITSGTISGTIRIRATYQTVLSEATQILVSAGPPKYITVAADSCNVPFWNVIDAEQGVVAIVSDIYNNPVNDSIMVYFWTEEGSMKSHEVRTNSLEGRVNSIWMSNMQPAATINGEVWVWAETAGGTVVDSTMFWNSFVPAVLTVTGLGDSIPADGKSKLVYSITAVDLNGNPVVAGTKYSVKGDPLGVTDGFFQDGCPVAWDEGEITSVKLEQDFSTPGPTDDGVGQVATVVFRSGYAVTSIHTVFITTGEAYSKESSIDCETSAAWSEAVPIGAVIKDRNGNPLGDHTLNMTASGGTVAGATQTTNQYGEAIGFSWTSPAADGTYTITITDTDPRGGIILTKQITVTAN